MKKQWVPPLNDEKDNKKRVFLIAAVVLISVILIISLVVLYSGLGKREQVQTDESSSEATDTDNQANEDAANLAEGSQDAEDTISDYVTQDSNGDSSTEETSDAMDVIATEVAPVDDVEDPQQEGTSGEEINVSDFTENRNTGTVTYGIDVAKWQGVIDWEQVKASGVEFAIVRVGYRTQVTGEIYEDPYAKYNMQQAQANGIKIGVYFFSTAVTQREAKEEAAWVADYIAPYPITYPVAYNCEGFSDSSNRQYGLDKGERTVIAAAFLDYIEKQGYTPMFYAAKNEMEQNAKWDAASLSSNYKIWVAQYPDTGYLEGSVSDYSGEHAMWQYTSKGQVPGIPKPVDINIAYFGYDQEAEAKDNTPQEEATADPAALINFTEVNETVTAKLETNLRSVPSGISPDTVISVLKNGDTATRTGIGDNGWSRVEYNGQVLYAVSSYLTTDLSPKATATPVPEKSGPYFTEVKEQVTAKKETNLRSEPGSTSADTIEAVLNNGEIVTRTGISDNGWSRVEYNGQVLYAVSNYLTTDVNYADNNTPTIDNPEAGITFTEVSEQITAKDKTNLRLLPSAESNDTIAAVLNHGDIALRTGIGNNGWSRIEYNGQTLYAVTSYLAVIEDN